jgi:hypothetical protein
MILIMVELEEKTYQTLQKIPGQSKFEVAKESHTIASAQRAPRPSGGIFSWGVFVATDLSSNKASLD